MRGKEFQKDLLGKPSHIDLLRLQDHEIKFLEIVKKTINARIKCDRDYAHALMQVSTIGGKLDMPDYKNPMFEAWHELVRSTNSLGQSIKHSADLLQSNTMDKLVTLIKDKQNLRRSYCDNRDRIDGQLTKTMFNDLDDRKSQYCKNEQVASSSRKTLDASYAKGKMKPAEQAADKLRRATMNLHHSHNNYVLQVMEAGNHQFYYRTQILPELLSNLSYMETECTISTKEILLEYVSLTSPCREEIIAGQKTTETAIQSINPDTQYEDFIQAKSSALESEADIRFDTGAVQRGEASNLPENQIELNMLTLQAIENQKNLLQDDIAVVEGRVQGHSTTLHDLHGEINQIHENMQHISLMGKKLEYVSRKLLHCEDSVLKEKLKAQFDILQAAQDALGDRDPPSGLRRYSSSSSATGLKMPSLDNLSQTSTQSESKFNLVKQLGKNISKNIGEMKKHLITDKYKLFDITRPIHEHEWYHGAIPRLEAVELLKNDGDFLLRRSGNASADYVISAKHDGQFKHFIIQTTPEGEFKFEGNPQPTVVGLVEWHYNNQQPVTKKSNCILRNAIPKDQWQLSHDDVQLGGPLGKGNFGDVYRAVLKKKNTEVQVAVKTCRDTVDSNTREKFLMEARILKGYDHPNIVKLIGVCTERQPIYIVMELVSGGDLNKYLKNESTLSPRQLIKMCHDACSGLKYLEDRNCIHRDVAARNCLITETKVVKITDFGMSREEEDGVYNVSGSMKQIPIKWTAPEALNYGKYTSASDVWSFGILSWEIFSNGQPPYPGLTNQNARDAVERGERMDRPRQCSERYYRDVMLKCWQANPDHRPKFADLCKTIKSCM